MSDQTIPAQDVIDAEAVKAEQMLAQFNTGKQQLTKDWKAITTELNQFKQSNPQVNTARLDAAFAGFGIGLTNFVGDVEGTTTTSSSDSSGGGAAATPDTGQIAIPTGTDGSEPTTAGTPAGDPSATSVEETETAGG